MLVLYPTLGLKSSNILRILNKLTLQKKLENVANNVFWDKNVKTQQQQNKKSNIKTRDLSHTKRIRYLFPTESTESNDCSHAI